MKKIACFTDIHISKSTIGKVRKFQKAFFESLKKEKPDFGVFLGDFFVHREAMPLDDLLLGIQFLKELDLLNIRFFFIDGNHDKVDQTSEKSYLTGFEGLFKNIEFISSFTDMPLELDGEDFYFIPYFEGEKLANSLSKVSNNVLLRKNNSYLFGHYTLEGIGGRDKETKVPIDSFKIFTATFSGHIHEKSTHKNFHYLVSCYQNSYHESIEKGYSIVKIQGSNYEINTKVLDLDYEYIDIVINIESIKELEGIEEEALKAKKNSKKSDVKVRLNLVGKWEILKSLNKKAIKEKGVDEIKTTYLSTNIKESMPQLEKNTRFVDKFQKFCQQNELDSEEGKFILNI